MTLLIPSLIGLETMSEIISEIGLLITFEIPSEIISEIGLLKILLIPSLIGLDVI